MFWKRNCGHIWDEIVAHYSHTQWDVEWKRKGFVFIYIQMRLTRQMNWYARACRCVDVIVVVTNDVLKICYFRFNLSPLSLSPFLYLARSHKSISLRWSISIVLFDLSIISVVSTSTPTNEAELQLYRVLQKASLLAYYDTLLEMGKLLE